jgi:integrase
MKITTFTDKTIKNLKPEEKKYIRGEGNGFSIRVMPSGVKTWLYAYSFDGKRREMNLGNYPDVSLETARGKFEDAKKKIKNGIDPMAEKEQAALERKQTPTVADFIEKEYIEKYAKKKIKRWQEVERALTVEVISRWGKRKITDITRRDIILLRDEIAVRAPVMANRVLAYVSGMFTYAIDQDALKVSPYTNIKRATKEAPKERALSLDEIKQLWNALDGEGVLMSDETRKAIKLILLTAQRPGEVIGMHSGEIDGHWWTIPGNRTKNGKTHRVYLTDTALSVIGNTEGRGYMFPAGRGKEGSMTVNALTFALRRNIKGHSTTKRDKVKRRNGEAYKRGPYKTDKPLPENPNRIGVEIFGAHDLRRTSATLMAAEKVPYETRERVLNHTMGKLDGIYNQHDFDDEKQMAMETLERKINSIITGTESKVISIQQGKKKAA